MRREKSSYIWWRWGMWGDRGVSIYSRKWLGYGHILVLCGWSSFRVYADRRAWNRSFYPPFNQKQTIICWSWHNVWICYCMVRQGNEPNGLRPVHIRRFLSHQLHSLSPKWGVDTKLTAQSLTVPVPLQCTCLACIGITLQKNRVDCLASVSVARFVTSG